MGGDQCSSAIGQLGEVWGDNTDVGTLVWEDSDQMAYQLTNFAFKCCACGTTFMCSSARQRDKITRMHLKAKHPDAPPLKQLPAPHRVIVADDVGDTRIAEIARSATPAGADYKQGDTQSVRWLERGKHM